MANSCTLLILGASTRAAAFAALRAGLTPWCADLFADADLSTRCRAARLSAREYPHGFVAAARSMPAAPCMYTGALENHPRIIAAIAQDRPLWGVKERELTMVRSPWALGAILEREGLMCPAHQSCTAPKSFPGERRWLLKPLRGAGGSGVRFWQERVSRTESERGCFLQQHIEGEARAACYVGLGDQSRLLGVTRQLTGEGWLHASGFHYCGSVGPVSLGATEQAHLQRLGKVLATQCGLRGLFGVDYVLCDGVPWAVEANPRYTASVEVLEYGAGVRALALHRAAFERFSGVISGQSPAGVVGKAILFARAPVVFPADGPWSATLRTPGPIEQMPGFADIPYAGEPIEARRPILTFFARAESESACLDQLKVIAADLDRWLHGR